MYLNDLLLEYLGISYRSDVKLSRDSCLMTCVNETES